MCSFLLARFNCSNRDRETKTEATCSSFFTTIFECVLDRRSTEVEKEIGHFNAVVVATLALKIDKRSLSRMLYMLWQCRGVCLISQTLSNAGKVPRFWNRFLWFKNITVVMLYFQLLLAHFFFLLNITSKNTPLIPHSVKMLWVPEKVY